MTDPVPSGRAPLEQDLLIDLARHQIRQFSEDPCPDLNSLWSSLVQSALAENVSEKYLTAACNAISVYLNTFLSSRSDGLRASSLSRQVWLEGFDCAQHAFASGKSKPALQVLETLVLLLNGHSDRSLATEILEHAATTMIAVVITDDPDGKLKAACITLSCFIRKTELSQNLHTLLQQCLHEHDVSWRRRRISHGISVWPPGYENGVADLFLALLFAINNLGSRSASLKLFNHICAAHLHISVPPSTVAARVLESYIQQNEETLDDFANNVLPALLDTEHSFKDFEALYAPCSSGSVPNVTLYLAVLRVGRLKEYVKEADLPNVVDGRLKAMLRVDSSGAELYSSFSILLRARNSRIRIHAYDLLTTSFATKASIPLLSLECINSSFRALFDDNDAYERGELMGITRRLFKRLDSSYAGLQKQQDAKQLPQHEAEIIGGYEHFVGSLSRSLSQELEIGVSYQRHITALGTLQLLLKTTFNNWQDDPLLRGRLTLLVLDPYEDVRAVASDVYAKLTKRRAVLGGGIDREFMEKSLKLSVATCRNDHADAAGRVMTLFHTPATVQPSGETQEAQSHGTPVLMELQSYLRSVQVLKPGTDFPLHAYILSLAHLFTSDPATSSQARAALETCDTIWELVQPVLCIDSPETGTEDVDEDQYGGPKDLLAYSWRALRDSSLLLQTVMSSDEQLLLRIGYLCLGQLVSLRHRGAFSAVAQSFAMCCDRVRASQDPAIRDLIRKWYDVAVQQIDAQAGKVTRRSAGLPSIFNGILSTELKFFEEVMTMLKQRATEAVPSQNAHAAVHNLPQVHALNCIKDIVTNSRFRTITESFIFELIELAADRMSSSIWAIRNCGLMLLRACMNRLNPKLMNASSESRGLGLDRSSSAPQQVAFSLVKASSASNASDIVDPERSEKVFAALDLLRQIGTPSSYDDPFEEVIRQYLGSPLWSIRQHAARVLAARVATRENCVQLLLKFLPAFDAPENEVHGVLLFYRAALTLMLQHGEGKTFSAVIEILSGVAERLQQRSSSRRCSSFVEGAFLDNLIVVLGFAVTATMDQLETSTITSVSQAAFASLSGKCSFSRQRLLLCKSLCFLLDLESVEGDLQSSFETEIAHVHANELEYIAEYLEGLLPFLTAAPRTKKLRELLCRAYSGRVDEQPSLLNAICTALDYDNFGWLPSEAKQIECRLNTSEAEQDNRQIWNAQIRLRAHTIRTLLNQRKDADMSFVAVELWLRDIATAGMDETEFPTRMNAAQALSSFLTGDTSNLVNLLRKQQDIHVQLLSILYDQLNDDDEEIRQLASLTAAKLSPNPEAADLRSAAYSARAEILRTLGCDPLKKNPIVHNMVLNRLMDCYHTTDLEHQTVQSVKKQLQTITQSMNDLFAEEKQNLYINTLDEIRGWSEILASCSSVDLSRKMWQVAAKWTVDGLKAFSALLARAETNEQNTGLGLTYNIGVLELCSRVICLAEGLKELGEKNITEHELPPGDIAVELDTIKMVLNTTRAHPSLVKAFRQ